MISSRASINDSIHSEKQTPKASDENKASQMMDNGVWPKNTVVIAGYAHKYQRGHIKQNVQRTKVRSFLGASVGDLFGYLKPLLKRKPGKTILDVGVNDVERNSA